MALKGQVLCIRPDYDAVAKALVSGTELMLVSSAGDRHISVRPQMLDAFDGHFTLSCADHITVSTLDGTTVLVS